MTAGLLGALGVLAGVLAALNSGGPAVVDGLVAAAALGSAAVVALSAPRAAASAAYAADLGAVLALGALMAAGGDVDVRVLAGAMAVPVLHAVGFQAPRQVAGLGVAAVAVAAAGLTIADRSLLVPLLALAPVAAVAPLVTVPVQAMRERLRLLGQREAEARRLADADALTGVGNYRVFWRALQAESARSARHGQPFSLAIVDLDDFKLVNDEHGHRVGDEALRAVADGLRSAVRASDVLCRQGGDEFAVVAAPSGPEDIAALAERLAAAVADATSARGLPRQITASAGTATFGPGGQSPEELVEAAELSLQAAKRERHGGRPRSRPAAARPVGSTRPLHAVERHGHPAVRLAVLGHLARALTAVRGERAIATTAVAHVAGAVDVRRVAVIKRHPADGRLELLALGGPAAERAPGDYRVADSAPLSIALQERRPALAVDDAGRGPAERTSALASQLAVPVPWNGEVWGALTLESEHPHGYEPRDVELVDAMAGQVGRSLRVGALLDELAELLHRGQRETLHERADSHGQAVSRLAVAVGKQLGLRPAALAHLRAAALFHELGAVCAPAAVVDKSGHLTDEEFAILRDHPLVGARLLHSLEGLQEASEIVRAQRERYDGQGYPEGLAGAEIPLAARILHACDAFVAMTSTRPYRAAVETDDAIDELRRGAGTQFDPAVVDALLGAIGGPHRLGSPT